MSLPVVDVANALSQIALAPSSPAALANKFRTVGRTLPTAPQGKHPSFSCFLLGNFFWRVEDCFTYTLVQLASEKMGSSFCGGVVGGGRWSGEGWEINTPDSLPSTGAMPYVGSCHLQIEMVLVLLFQFMSFLFLFLASLLWPGLPAPCWMAVKAGVFVLFLVIESKLSMFHRWVRH